MEKEYKTVTEMLREAEQVFDFSQPDADSAWEVLVEKITKQYNRDKLRRWRKMHRQVMVSFTPAKAKKISVMAKKQNLTLSQYIQRCVQACLDDKRFVYNKKQMRQTEVLLARLGSNVNQITRAMHQGRVSPENAEQRVVCLLDDAKREMRRISAEAIDIMELIEQYVSEFPEERHTIKNFLMKRA